MGSSRGALGFAAVLSLALASPFDLREASFHSETVASSCSLGPVTSHSTVVSSNSSVWPYQTYVSSPITPPYLTISSPDPGPLAPGYIFFEPSGPGAKQSAPFIMTQSNELVYALQNSPGTTDFRMQQIAGKPYLTTWIGRNTNGANIGHGYGRVLIYDDTYTLVYDICPDLGLNVGQVTPKPPCQIDIHEHQITPRNTLLVTAYNNTRADLSPFGGSATDGWINDCLFFEIELDTQRILFSWSARDHVPLAASHQPLVSRLGNGTAAAPWDYFHINAVQAVGGDYLVNARHTWSTYLVSGSTGEILWAIEGDTGGDFGPLPAGGNFRWQHFARVRELTAGSVTVSWFNNYNAGPPFNGTNATDGLVLSLPLPPSKSGPRPTLLRRLERPADPLFAVSQGSYSTSVDGTGNQFMGYGAVPVLREYGPAPDGSQLRWQGRFGGGYKVQSYRGFKFLWSGTPAQWDPRLALQATAATTSDGGGGGGGSDGCCARAFVSWNGATGITGWSVYEGTGGAASAGALALVGNVSRMGFETSFGVPAKGCVQVGALRGDQEVRRSNVACL